MISFYEPELVFLVLATDALDIIEYMELSFLLFNFIFFPPYRLRIVSRRYLLNIDAFDALLWKEAELKLSLFFYICNL